ncbi:aldehyde dehydrogenase (NAD+) [Alkalihalobacillus xiaoxiensis]|uniref:Aldehyde dehydrogenase n=1 Tax=Shouchella xiaoxiensis TaxID=766895 RepID=A0ABS2SPL7_9BACI|nr:aldehyde dehydrogenase [Shouchella xiaoxiensis]MBM7837464.1 aldehyde dehydrogenase (NAD+) [Shouchella xiaoxiensis]
MYETLKSVQQEYVFSGATKSASFRKKQLTKLKNMLIQHEEEFLQAVNKDLNKQETEAFMMEIGNVHQEITHAIDSLDEWMEPVKVKTPVSHTGSKSYILSEPYGSVLIIAPWNYPIQLTFSPLVGALAAGNCAVVKPSELTPHTSSAIAGAIRATFPQEIVSAVEGDAKTAEALLDQPFDYIFFTGSVAVGKIVMEKAAKHLTPHTLELGGKSPAIVTEDAKLDLAAKRIAWGKFTNAGQTCIAPDYVLVHESVHDKFLKKLQDHTYEMFADKTKNGTFTQIVNEKHFNRLYHYLDNGHVVLGGQYSKENRLISPTILTNVSWNSPIMQDEIFGPILPVFTYKSSSEALMRVRSLPNPLALYVFSEREASQQLFTEQLSFGGGCINDTLMHVANPYLPFGGKGPSGIGAYHGFESFRTFSHQKGMLKQTTKFDMPLRYKQGKLANKMIRNVFK